ncbi:MAG: hypothetical protein CVT92_17415 [Bacteroidetes bacterium HGW-Bacteroidetes-1]|jgi:tetratricopeptide (TPR) repeat protein|nr:MAG: hypothetical protein CVT92_17415 [Bacteroidetes bacterium HGW-Bacteroidetes-1]
MKTEHQYFFLNFLLALLFHFILFSHNSIAQVPNNGSISILPEHEKNPYKKANLLLDLAEKNTDSRQAVMYAENAIVLADSLGLKPLKYRAMELSGVAWKINGNFLKSIERLTEVLTYVEQEGSLRDVALVKLKLGETYRAARNYDISLAILKEALSFFEQTNDTTELARTFNRLAATQIEQFQTAPDYIPFVSGLKNSGKPYNEVLRNCQ